MTTLLRHTESFFDAGPLATPAQNRVSGPADTITQPEFVVLSDGTDSKAMLELASVVPEALPFELPQPFALKQDRSGCPTDEGPTVAVKLLHEGIPEKIAKQDAAGFELELIPQDSAKISFQVEVMLGAVNLKLDSFLKTRDIAWI